jgi:hypothetical protein
MTPTSLLHFLEALCWATVVFVAVTGYGTLALSMWRMRGVSVALAAVTGFGVVILIGGCLNLLHAISPVARFLLVAVGVVGFLLRRPVLLSPSDAEIQAAEHRARSRWTRPALLLAAVVFLVRIGASVHTSYYQHEDDYNFYLAAPVKMAALHQYAADPFSERRIMSSLGGNYFLQTLMLSELPVEDIQMADRALGLWLLIFVALGLGEVFRLTPLQRALLGLFLLLTPQLQFNLTFVILPYALFCGLVFLAANIEEFEARPILHALLLGVAAATIASLKSTYLPHGVLFFICIGLIHARRRGVRAGVRSILFASIGCLVVLGPWMLANHFASHTWLYPLLGKGYQYSAYGLFPPPSSGSSLKIIVKVMLFNVPLVGVLFAEWFWCERDEKTRVLVALTAAALGASILVGIATGGDSVRRYNYPAILAAILLLYLAASRKANVTPSLRSYALEWASAALCVCMAFYVGMNSWTHEYSMTLKCLHTSLTDFHIEPRSTVASYAAMESAIPAGADQTIATVDFPFLLDFKAHPIHIADIPGAASPPPGWPSRSDGEALAAYLLSQHQRYLAFTTFSLPDAEKRVKDASTSPNATQWIRSEDEIRLASFRQFDQLAASRHHLYDDGNLILLDLATKAK